MDNQIVHVQEIMIHQQAKMLSRDATACDGGTQEDSCAPERWSSLPDDLLDISYLRVAALIDRVRFAALCTAWRVVASMHPARGILPWLLLDPKPAATRSTCTLLASAWSCPGSLFPARQPAGASLVVMMAAGSPHLR